MADPQSPVQVGRLWATRPEHQNEAWRKTLMTLGLPVVDVPLMVIEPVSDPADIQSVKNLILDFDQFQKVIFVSQNAVHEAFRWLQDYWPQLPVGIEYFAVGDKTAAAVEAEGLSVISCSRTMDSEEMLALPQLTSVWGEKILIFRGRGGLPRMGQVLQERGAIVRYCELYHRRLPAQASIQAASFLADIGLHDIVPLFSGETLQNFEQVLERNGCPHRNMLVIVPGKRVAQMAANMGFARVIAAENASASTMLAAVQEAVRRRTT